MAIVLAIVNIHTYRLRGERILKYASRCVQSKKWRKFCKHGSGAPPRHQPRRKTEQKSLNTSPERERERERETISRRAEERSRQ